MRVDALDHVNILTRDVEASVHFYADLLGLVPRLPIATMPPERGRWLLDDGGHPIIHLGRNDAPADGTGAIHHVALRCTGVAEMRGRLDARGIHYRVNTVPELGLTQVFAHDPHGVLLELNFPGE